MQNLATIFTGFTKKEENEKVASVFTTYFVFYMHFFNQKMIFVLLLNLSIILSSTTSVFAQTAEPSVFAESFYMILMSEDDEETSRGLEACSVRFRERLTATGRYQEQNSQEFEELVTSSNQEGPLLNYEYEYMIENIQAELELILSVESFQQERRGFIFNAHLIRTMNETTVWGSDIHIENEDLIIFAAREACDELSFQLLETLNPNSSNWSRENSILAQDNLTSDPIGPRRIFGGFRLRTEQLPSIFRPRAGRFPSIFRPRARQLRRSCDNGGMSDCNDLGDKYLNGEGVPRDFEEAVRLYQLACNGGNSSSCFELTNLGNMNLNGEGVTQDHEEAIRLYQMVCDSGSSNGCSDLIGLGNIYRDSENYEEAIRIYQLACDGGDCYGLTSLGNMYRDGEGVTQDYEEASRLYQLACDSGDLNSCLELTHLGNRYQNGEGVARDSEEAVRLFRIACDGGEMTSCVHLGNMYRDGEGVTQDYEEALRLYCIASGITCDLIPEGFVLIPAGSFMMGSPENEERRNNNEGPQREVTITRSFYMRAHEVTQGEWEELMGNNPSHFSNCGSDCPVENVNWYEALAYANALSESFGLEECYVLSGCINRAGNDMECSNVSLNNWDCGYRLPTEAEWEYAAKAGSRTAFYDGEQTPDGIAWYGEDENGSTHSVGQLEANSWGLYDMSGNVWEWCWDNFNYYELLPTNDPIGADFGYHRVYRGGSWRRSASNARSARRRDRNSGYRSRSHGFRLVGSVF